MLKNIINKNLLEARAIVAFYPANSVGDDIYVYESEGWRMIHPLPYPFDHFTCVFRLQIYFLLQDFHLQYGD